MIGWFYNLGNFMIEKDSQDYKFGSVKEKFISCLDVSIAFDSIILIFSILIIVIMKKKMLTLPLSKILSSFLLLFYFGKAMAGGFYILGATNEIIHDNMKDNLKRFNDSGLTIPDVLIAWEVSYYTIIASLIGEFLCSILISSMIFIEGNKIFNNSVVPT